LEDFGVFKPEVPQVPEVDSLPRSEPAKPAEILPEIDTTNLQTENVSKFHVIHREGKKVHSRPRVEAGSTIRRALITFVSRTGQVRRWAFDCVFSPRRKPHILEFQGKVQRKNVKDARFYFPVQATDRDVRNLVGSWFTNLQVHDESAALNLMGSPESYNITILDEA
jgi:hypothetical protein